MNDGPDYKRAGAASIPHPAVHGDRPHYAVVSHRTPLKWLTPTHLELASYARQGPGATWQSRKARKGRYSQKDSHLYNLHPHEADSHRKLALTARIADEKSKFKPGWYVDISWWLAFTFTLGSAVWVVNG
jgi:hypothetical protein